MAQHRGLGFGGGAAGVQQDGDPLGIDRVLLERSDVGRDVQPFARAEHSPPRVDTLGSVGHHQGVVEAIDQRAQFVVGQSVVQRDEGNARPRRGEERDRKRDTVHSDEEDRVTARVDGHLRAASRHRRDFLIGGTTDPGGAFHDRGLVRPRRRGHGQQHFEIHFNDLRDIGRGRAGSGGQSDAGSGLGFLSCSNAPFTASGPSPALTHRTSTDAASSS